MDESESDVIYMRVCVWKPRDARGGLSCHKIKPKVINIDINSFCISSSSSFQ